MTEYVSKKIENATREEVFIQKKLNKKQIKKIRKCENNYINFSKSINFLY